MIEFVKRTRFVKSCDNRLSDNQGMSTGDYRLSDNGTSDNHGMSTGDNRLSDNGTSTDANSIY